MITKLSDLGFCSGPSVDNMPAWNAMVAAAGPSWVAVDGAYTFKTKPNPIERCMRIDGIAVNASGLYRDYQPETDAEPFIHIKSTSKIGAFCITAASGTRGVALYHEGLSASDSVCEDMWISAKSDARWFIPVSACGADPDMGIRDMHYRNIEIFAATAHLYWGRNIHGFAFVDVNFYPAGGTKDHITIQGGPNGGRSGGIMIATRFLRRAYFYDTDNATIRGVELAQINANNCLNIRQL